MVSDFRRKKLLHVFQTFFDTDKNGSVEKADFDLIAEKVAKLNGWSAGDAKYKEINASLNKIWEGLKKADANNDGSVSAEEWIAMCDESIKNPNPANEWQNQYMKFMFALEDASDDGSIDKDEFVSVYVSFGLKKDECDAAFQKMSQGKASISRDEFQKLWKEYFVSDDVNAQGNYIFGKTSF